MITICFIVISIMNAIANDTQYLTTQTELKQSENIKHQKLTNRNNILALAKLFLCNTENANVFIHVVT